MTPFLVYLPPGAGRDSADAVFLADRFAWPAFVFPALWLLFKRQWMAGVAVFILQTAMTMAGGLADAGVAAIFIELALRLLVALEGPTYLARRLEKRGFTLAAVLPAPDLKTAEAMYGATLEGLVADPALPLPRLGSHQNGGRAGDPANPGFGLFDTYGSR
ncbi:hypothetical protein ASG25_17695 [Rhizobium sp. Leaf384]|uniref:DUF2628 domain-containing protein n=1 Tax=unclassified Rhizobium TaxID=2613769 RepID=UPI0007136DF9|nr:MULTISPECIES: DUF2628 domain-containing protein [unclassified Rhizobium]KQS76067.1 hypothetical protein ASG25_17695 [Rhizobium sp. Leaf384]KQS85812.1 hypothetical protein ASG58_18080 [Rhizobium sp. Leaf383]